MSVYLNDWAGGGGNYQDEGLDGLKADFQIGNDILDGVTILVASYTYEDYSGDAYVLFTKDDKLYEVHGGHCSCMGLEDQWDPEEADIDAIRHRVAKGTWGEEHKVKDAILTALDAFSNRTVH